METKPKPTEPPAIGDWLLVNYKGEAIAFYHLSELESGYARVLTRDPRRRFYTDGAQTYEAIYLSRK